MASSTDLSHSQIDIENIVSGANSIAWEHAKHPATAGPIAAALIMLALRDSPATEIASLLRKKAKRK